MEEEDDIDAWLIAEDAKMREREERDTKIRIVLRKKYVEQVNRLDSWTVEHETKENAKELFNFGVQAFALTVPEYHPESARVSLFNAITADPTLKTNQDRLCDVLVKIEQNFIQAQRYTGDTRKIRFIDEGTTDSVMSRAEFFKKIISKNLAEAKSRERNKVLCKETGITAELKASFTQSIDNPKVRNNDAYEEFLSLFKSKDDIVILCKDLNYGYIEELYTGAMEFRDAANFNYKWHHDRIMTHYDRIEELDSLFKLQQNK
jgi:hypothetical protein